MAINFLFWCKCNAGTKLCLNVQECGVVNRVTILTDKFGGAKGYAYIEFDKADAAVSAVLLDGTELRNRNIKVTIYHQVDQRCIHQ